MKCAFRLALLLLCVAIPAASLAAEEFVPVGERSEKAIKGGELPFWPARFDQAEVVTAFFEGGPGNEWLVGGDFLPDKTLVLAGNVADPVFDLGVKATILGTDGAPPAEFVRGKNKKGESERPSWTAPGVTGFLVRMSSDYKKVVSVSRLPWDSASIHRHTPSTIFAALHEPYQNGVPNQSQFRRIQQNADGIAAAISGKMSQGAEFDDRLLLQFDHRADEAVQKTPQLEAGPAAKPLTLADAEESFTFRGHAIIRRSPLAILITGNLLALKLKVTDAPKVTINGTSASITIVEGPFPIHESCLAPGDAACRV